ncbi:MAG: peptide chain release factor 1 [Epsilonproteobacteria bacterium]|nr:peptide chain release factor 1 [Campylobacterota bacterium]NPA56330.1 peptide chain release factor 1 [Campylobacterota bacterium]
MLKEKLKPFIERYEEINRLLSSPDITNNIQKMTELSKEQSDLEPLVQKAREYYEVDEAIEESKALIDDEELGELAKEELRELEPRKERLEEEIKLLLIPKDPNDEKDIYLEIRAGTGGEEAALFAADLFRTYTRYAEKKRWKVEIVSSSESDTGGYKEIIARIQGEGVYSRLKYEAGTHRVQRIPQTESQGRIHTSAVTVAIMPEVDDVDVEINPADLKIDVYRSSGHGGQSVNTTDSAVRITHIPTGIVVAMQDEKSQHKNREKALKILKARIYEKMLREQQEALAKDRKEQVGSGDRSERIRTYNYPQNRITDHRIGLTLYKLEEIMEGGELDQIIEPLIAHYQAQKVKEAGL